MDFLELLLNAFVEVLIYTRSVQYLFIVCVHLNLFLFVWFSVYTNLWLQIVGHANV